MTPPARARAIRVLIVDDSAFARKVMRQVLAAEADIEVVGIARDGLDALEQIATLAPDVVTLDLLMPNLDGLGVLRALRVASGHAPAGAAEPPRVVVVSTAESDADLAVEALQAGAVEFVHKTTSLATDRLYELGGELVAKVRTASIARSRRESPGHLRAPAAIAMAQAPRVLVIGASTGGPQAIGSILSALPGDLPVPVALVLHMPIGYTAALAARLDTMSPLHVVEATEGLVLRPGLVVVARAGAHLRLAADARAGDVAAHFDFAPIDTPHRPAVDVLFASAAAAYGSRTLGVVLTGMGDDGLVGSRAIVAAGGRVLTEAESSCVVYGMPRVVAEAGLSCGSFPVSEIPAAVRQMLGM